MNARARFASLCAALALALSGVVALALHPVDASAAGLAPVPADITVQPGQTVSKTFDHPMVGAQSLEYGPATCRTSPFSLTCGTTRIKIGRLLPGYFLRIQTSWLGQSTLLEAVPDIDTYLYDTADGHLGTDAGGATPSDLPETIDVEKPLQDQYDLVVVNYAGATKDYTVTVQYLNEKQGVAPHVADATMNAHDAPTIKNVTTPLVGYTGDPALYPVVTFTPSQCRDPIHDAVCDVYRIHINRNRAPDAENFMRADVAWDVSATTPDLPAVAVGVNGAQVPHIAMFVYDTDSHMLPREQVGGQDSIEPQKVAWTATQDEYDLVVQVTLGVVPSYKLTLKFSDETFNKPFELLDPLLGQPADSSGNYPDGSVFTPGQNDAAVPPLALAPIDDDSQISGIGLGTTQQFDQSQALQLGREALRNTSVVSKPPSGVILWLSLVILPFGLLGFGIFYMRRRHTELV